MATADQVVKWLQIVDLGAKSSAYSHHVNAAHNALVSSTLAVVSGNGGEAPEHPTSPPGPSPSKSKSKE